MANEENLQDEFFVGLVKKGKKYSKVKKISFTDNQISNFSGLIEVFPNAQRVVLSYNLIK